MGEGGGDEDNVPVDILEAVAFGVWSRESAGFVREEILLVQVGRNGRICGCGMYSIAIASIYLNPSNAHVNSTIF